jgi:hypothetical protein
MEHLAKWRIGREVYDQDSRSGGAARFHTGSTLGPDTFEFAIECLSWVGRIMGARRADVDSPFRSP